MASRRAGAAVFALLLPLAASVPAPAAERRGEATIDVLLVSVDLEKRGRAEDLDELEKLTNRLGRAEASATAARGRLLQLLKDGVADTEAFESAEETIADAEARVRAGEERRRAIAARIVERSRRILALNDEIAKRRAGLRGVSDPLTGRWSVVINPGARRGTYRLVLDGTLISGDYALDGGFSGSLRGTLVSNKVTLERVDSELGLDARFYGRLIPAQKRIVGTWDGTQIAPVTGPTAGEWVANQLPDREEAEDH